MARKSDAVTASFETGMLSYARSLQVAEGFFFGVNGNEAIPIEVFEKGVRGQSSEDGAQKPGESSPQTVEFAVLPQGCTAVELRFSARIVPRVVAPHACNKPKVAETYKEFAELYARVGGFTRLAELYTWNIANARFAWRNRFQVEGAKVRLTFLGQTLAFDPSMLSLEYPADRDEMTAALVEGDRASLDRFIDGMAYGLVEVPFAFDVTWVGDMRPGQELFPSQEYVRDEKKASNVSRIYAKLPVLFAGREINQASMHSQKIGAALRHIDIWHGDETYGAIAVNPYGGVQETGAVLRKPGSKNSFYDIRKDAQGVLDAVSGAQTAADIPDRIHFMMANLVRGGVFGVKGKASEVNS